MVKRRLSFVLSVYCKRASWLTAQLQHRAIAPVYGAGRLKDRHRNLAKNTEAQTLYELLHEGFPTKKLGTASITRHLACYIPIFEQVFAKGSAMPTKSL